MKHLLLCLFTLLITDILFAQTNLSDYYVRHFTSENGLSQNTVKSIAEDDYGFIWLATESGLLRFDGCNFKQFDKTNTGIHTSRMFDIQRSADGNTLVAISSAKELLVISKGKAQRAITGSPAGNMQQSVIPGGIHRAVFRGDLAALQKKSRSKNHPVKNCRAIGQFFLYTGQNLFLAEPLPDGSINTKLLLSGFDLDHNLVCCAYYDSLHQRLFMGSLTNGLYILERKKFYAAIYHGKEEHPTINIVYDHVAFNDSAVLTGNGTICYTNPAIPVDYLKFPDDYEPDRHAHPIFQAANGNIWICGRNRIFMLDKTAVSIKKEWACTGPMALAESRGGRIWIGTEHSGLFVLDMRDPHAEPRLVLRTRDHIMSIEEEGEQFLWICTMRHLLRMNINTGAIDTITGLNDKMARSLYIPHPGEVWICTYEDGLFLWREQKLTHFIMPDYPYLKTVHKVLEDENGYFWISTNHGIYQARRADMLAYADREQEEPYLFYYSKESGFLTNEFNGGSSYVGTKLNNGFFCFSSMNGVIFFKPSAIKPELPEEKFIIDKLEVDDKEITPLNGVVTLNRKFKTFKITPVSAYMGDPANQKYEFHLNGDSDWSNTYNGAIILSSLPTGHNNIFIRKKAGFGKEHYMICNLRIYVPPAWWQTPCFYISAGILLIVLIWLIIRVRVHHWKKRNLLLEAAIQRRTQDLKDVIHNLEHSENRLGEQLQFQTKLNEQITHDVTTPLKYLGMFTKQVLNGVGSQNGVSPADMQYVHQDINRMYEVVQNLGEYMRTRLSKNISRASFNLYDLVKQKAALFRIAATANNNIIENRTSPVLFIHHNEPLISIVLHNLIDNAVKNTEDGKIIISTTVENGTITLCIADTGKGMAPAQIQACNDYFKQSRIDRSLLNTGFGFQIIKEIATLQKLEIRVTANHEKGIVFQLLIPQNEYGRIS